MSNWDKEEIEHFESALVAVPYVSAVLQNDEEGFTILNEGEPLSSKEVAVGMACLAALLVQVVSDLCEQDQMETIMEITEFLDDAIGEFYAEV